MRYIQQFPELAPIYRGADHTDVKVVEGRINLRTFLARMFSSQPKWVSLLYQARVGVAALLRLRQVGIPRPLRLHPEEMAMTPGEKVSFFTVQLAQEDRYWVARGQDSHLDAALSVVVEPLPDGLNRFHVMTTVYYHNRTGRLYFNLIRPFHHLIIAMKVSGAVRPV